jgi:hypothetical protein
MRTLQTQCPIAVSVEPETACADIWFQLSARTGGARRAGERGRRGVSLCDEDFTNSMSKCCLSRAGNGLCRYMVSTEHKSSCWMGKGVCVCGGVEGLLVGEWVCGERQRGVRGGGGWGFAPLHARLKHAFTCGLCSDRVYSFALSRFYHASPLPPSSRGGGGGGAGRGGGGGGGGGAGGGAGREGRTLLFTFLKP